MRFTTAGGLRDLSVLAAITMMERGYLRALWCSVHLVGGRQVLLLVRYFIGQKCRSGTGSG